MMVMLGVRELKLDEQCSLHQQGGPGGEWHKYNFWRAVLTDGDKAWPPLELCLYGPDARHSLWLGVIQPTTADMNPAVEANGDTAQNAVDDLWEALQADERFAIYWSCLIST